MTPVALANQIAAGIKCDVSGSCVVFAAELAQHTLKGVRVVEGWVRFAGSGRFPHVWTEWEGQVIDPTLAQFDFFELDTVERHEIAGYDSANFLVAIQKHPQWSRFKDLKKL